MRKTRAIPAILAGVTGLTVSMTGVGFLPTASATTPVCAGVSLMPAHTSHLRSGVTRRELHTSDGVLVQVVSAPLAKTQIVAAHAQRLTANAMTTAGVVRFAQQRKNAIITVNGGYFYHGVPTGPLVGSGSVLHVDPYLSAAARPHALTVDAAGAASFDTVTGGGRLRVGSSQWPIAAVNSTVPSNGVYVYTSDWRGTPLTGLAFKVGSSKVVVRGALARQVMLTKGPRSIRLQATTASQKSVAQAVGTGITVLNEGVPRCKPNNPSNSRVAVGLSKDRKRFFIVTAILNKPMAVRSKGFTPYQVGRVLQDAGAWTGAFLDGGGSTAMIQYHGTRNIAYTADRYIRPTPSGVVLESRR